MSKYSIKAEILTWTGKKPSKNLQSIARNKRYELLFDQCDKLKIVNLLLGHHQEDLFENFFIRMSRGSGLKGLISLDKKTKIQNKNLIRPLLNQKKDDLTFVSKEVFDFYVNDPSNENKQFLRIRIRKLLRELKKNGLDEKKFLNTIKNLKYSNSVVDYYVNENLKKNSFLAPNNKKLMLNKNFFNSLKR